MFVTAVTKQRVNYGVSLDISSYIPIVSWFTDKSLGDRSDDSFDSVDYDF